MGITIVKIGFFFGGAILFSRVVLFPIALLADYMNVPESKLALVLSTLFAFSYVADQVGLHFIIGSFMAGIIDEKIFAAVVGMVAITVVFIPVALKYAIQILEKKIVGLCG